MTAKWQYKEAYEAALVTTRELSAENAKLRELVRTIYMCSCIQCNRCDYGHGDSCAFDAESELRELGVEVDG